MSKKNYYTTLNVTQTATYETIKKAYRALAKKYHPDNNLGDKVAEKKMQEVAEAWSVLRDEASRKKYDNEIDSDGVNSNNTTNPFTKKTTQKTTPKTNRPMTQEDFYNMTRNFDNSLSPEAIKESVNKNKKSGTGFASNKDFFEKVMGFKM